jgi:hypothetical protein
MENLLDYDQKGTSHVGKREYSYVTGGTESTVKKENKSNVQTSSHLFHLTAELLADALHFVI